MNAGKLYVVATPIGHLGDFSLRAAETLKQVALVAAEDTRTARILLNRYGIHTPLESFHDHSGEHQLNRLLDLLGGGASVALISENGTPLISDPGFPLVRRAVEKGIPVTVIPGPSAVIAALVVSGFPCERFIFEGFFPVKSGERRRRLAALQEEERTVIYFESPYRVMKMLTDAEAVLPEREFCVVKELTKKFEEVFRGRPAELKEVLAKRSIKGEYTIVIKGKRD